MGFIEQLSSKVRGKFSSQFIRNISWLGLSELIPRICRLGVVVVLARFLTSYDYGLVAIVLAVSEFTRVFMDFGVNAKIIQADDANVEELSNSGYWLNWVIFVSLFIIQILVAFPVAWFYRDNQLILPICVGGIPYLIWPWVAVKNALIQRENRLKITAIHNTVQNSLSYILSAVLASQHFGLWSILLPGVLVAPIGAVIYNINHDWQPTSGFTTHRWGEIIGFGKNILGGQFLTAVRNNLDYLIVGRFLGIEQLGIYFFGFNAGLGISLSVISALGTATFPYFCEARSEFAKLKQRYQNSLKTIAFVIVPLVLLQVSLAPIYVPILFSPKWVVAVPVLMLICLSAIPRPFAGAASQLLVAVDRPHLVLRWDICGCLSRRIVDASRFSGDRGAIFDQCNFCGVGKVWAG